MSHSRGGRTHHSLKGACSIKYPNSTVHSDLVHIVVNKKNLPQGLSAAYTLSIRVSFQHSITRFIAISRQDRKPPDKCLELSNWSEIWQISKQHCCRGKFPSDTMIWKIKPPTWRPHGCQRFYKAAYQISKRSSDHHHLIMTQQSAQNTQLFFETFWSLVIST